MSGNYTLMSHQCPKCGAALEVIPDQEIITCDYCSNTFSIKEKEAPQAAPAPQPAPQPAPAPKPNYDYKNVYQETQKQLTQAGKKTARTGALVGVFMTIAILAFSGFMAFRAQKEVRTRQNQVQKRIKNQQRAHKMAQDERKKKQWLEFRIENSESLAAAKIKKVKDLVKTLKLPAKGDKAGTPIYIFGHFTSSERSRMETFRKKMKVYQVRHPKKIKYYFVPIPQENRNKFKGAAALLEVLFQKGPDTFWRFWRKQIKLSGWYFGTKEMLKIAKRLKLNTKELKKALIKNVHKEKLDKLTALAESLDLPDKNIAILINKNLYKTYSVLSRFDYVMEWELHIKK